MNHPAFSPPAASNATVGARNAATSPSSSSSSQPGRRSPASHPAFSSYVIELEFMIAERDSLAALPIADRLLLAGAGVQASDVDRGLLGWSNELVLHVIEIKNQAPSASLAMLVPAFQSEVRYFNRLLVLYGARLMPTAMHPW